MDDDAKTVVLVCERENCVNQGVPITMQVPTDCGNYLCGPCGQAIRP